MRVITSILENKGMEFAEKTLVQFVQEIEHPERKSIEIHQNEGGQFRLVQTAKETGTINSPLLKDFKLNLEKIF